MDNKIWHPNSFSFKSFTPPSFTSASFSAPLPSSVSLNSRPLEDEIARLKGLMATKDEYIKNLEGTISQLKSVASDQNCRATDNQVRRVILVNVFLGFVLRDKQTLKI